VIVAAFSRQVYHEQVSDEQGALWRLFCCQNSSGTDTFQQNRQGKTGPEKTAQADIVSKQN